MLNGMDDSKILKTYLRVTQKTITSLNHVIQMEASE